MDYELVYGLRDGTLLVGRGGGVARQPLLAQYAGALTHRFLRSTIFEHGHRGVGFLALTNELPVRGCALLLVVNVMHADRTRCASESSLGAFAA